MNSHESLFEKARLGIVELEELYITAELGTLYCSCSATQTRSAIRICTSLKGAQSTSDCADTFSNFHFNIALLRLVFYAETTLSPAQWDLMNTIRCSGETLLTLVTDILDFSRIEADKMVLAPTEFHLQTVIEAAMEIAGLHAAQKRLQVSNCIYICCCT